MNDTRLKILWVLSFTLLFIAAIAYFLTSSRWGVGFLTIGALFLMPLTLPETTAPSKENENDKTDDNAKGANYGMAFLLVLLGSYGIYAALLDDEAHQLGYGSASDYRDAQLLGISTPAAYEIVKRKRMAEQKEARIQKSIEEDARRAQKAAQTLQREDDPQYLKSLLGADLKELQMNKEVWSATYEPANIWSGSSAIIMAGSHMRTIGKWMAKNPTKRIPAKAFLLRYNIPASDKYGNLSHTHGFTLRFDADDLKLAQWQKLQIGIQIINLSSPDKISPLMSSSFIEFCKDNIELARNFCIRLSQHL